MCLHFPPSTLEMQIAHFAYGSECSWLARKHVRSETRQNVLFYPESSAFYRNERVILKIAVFNSIDIWNDFYLARSTLVVNMFDSFTYDDALQAFQGKGGRRNKCVIQSERHLRLYGDRNRIKISGERQTNWIAIDSEIIRGKLIMIKCFYHWLGKAICARFTRFNFERKFKSTSENSLIVIVSSLAMCQRVCGMFNRVYFGCSLEMQADQAVWVWMDSRNIHGVNIIDNCDN